MSISSDYSKFSQSSELEEEAKRIAKLTAEERALILKKLREQASVDEERRVYYRAISPLIKSFS